MISVIVTCHNKEEYLEECIASLADQTLQPTEIIIVHDGCKSFGVHDHAINVITTHNNGVAKARDLGFKMSTKPTILFLDGDDKLSPLFLQKTYHLIKDNGADIAYPDLLWWFQHTNYKGQNVYHPTERLVTPEQMIKINSVTTTSLMKRHVYEKVGGFDVEQPIYEDWFFFLEAMAKGFKFAHASTYLWYRQTKNTRNRQNDDLKKAAFQKVLELFEVREGKLWQK